jgi:hypothetical protein
MYVAALRLAPLALVQSVAASGVAVLAFATARGHPSRLARREQAAVVLAIAGLTLLALSLVDTAESDQPPPALGIVIWLAACGGGAALLIAVPTRFGRAASLGLAAGLLFADGDISAKLIGYGGMWLVALVSLIVGYAVGTSVLQWAYQRGDALTAAGTATMVTNAVPIAAGFVLFGEDLPHGTRAVLQVAAFACLVVSAVALGRQQPPRTDGPAARAEQLPGIKPDGRRRAAALRLPCILLGRGGAGDDRARRRDGSGPRLAAGLARGPRTDDRRGQGRVRPGPAGEGGVRRAHRPGAHLADLRGTGRGHVGHPRGAARATAGPRAQPGAAPAGELRRQVGRLRVHRAGGRYRRLGGRLVVGQCPRRGAGSPRLPVFRGVGADILARRGRGELPPRPAPRITVQASLGPWAKRNRRSWQRCKRC